MKEDEYLELKKFIESYEKRHTLDKHPHGDKTLNETKQRIKDYESNKMSARLTRRFYAT